MTACKAFVAEQLRLDVRTCEATSGETWVQLAARLVSNDDQAQRVRATAQRLRRQYRRPYSL
jgi:hypothetical protein